MELSGALVAHQPPQCRCGVHKTILGSKSLTERSVIRRADVLAADQRYSGLRHRRIGTAGLLKPLDNVLAGIAQRLRLLNPSHPARGRQHVRRARCEQRWFAFPWNEQERRSELRDKVAQVYELGMIAAVAVDNRRGTLRVRNLVPKSLNAIGEFLFRNPLGIPIVGSDEQRRMHGQQGVCSFYQTNKRYFSTGLARLSRNQSSIHRRD